MTYNNIIKSYERYKADGSTETFYLSTEPRFISSTLKNGTRNLEEQLLLGNSCKITTVINDGKTLYTVTKIFGDSSEYFKIITDYNILNSNLLLYIVVDERDGNYIIKTANSLEEGTKYNNNIITLSDNSIYTLKNLGYDKDSSTFPICTEKLYYGASLISTKTITGKVNGNVFDTTITIS